MFCDIKTQLDHPAVRRIIAYSMFAPSTETMDNKLTEFCRHQSWQLYGWVEKDEILGVCGFEVHSDRVNGSFGVRWCEWHHNGWFGELENAVQMSTEIDNGYLGLMTINSQDQSNFSYWIGILFPEGTEVPEGFSYLDLPENDVAINWIYGSDKNGEIYGSEPHSASYNKLCENGWFDLNINAGGENTLVFFELYNCPRFTTPDDKGNVILDYGFYLK